MCNIICIVVQVCTTMQIILWLTEAVLRHYLIHYPIHHPIIHYLTCCSDFYVPAATTLEAFERNLFAEIGFDW